MIAEDRGGVYKEYVRDTLGSTIKLIDDNQNITDTWTYWPYGEVRTRTGTTATPFQFGGTRGYYTGLANMQYVRARFVLAQVARWKTRDPIWPRQWPYAYVVDSPVTLVDPSGRFAAALAPILFVPGVGEAAAVVCVAVTGVCAIYYVCTHPITFPSVTLVPPAAPPLVPTGPGYGGDDPEWQKCVEACTWGRCVPLIRQGGLAEWACRIGCLDLCTYGLPWWPFPEEPLPIPPGDYEPDPDPPLWAPIAVSGHTNYQ